MSDQGLTWLIGVAVIALATCLLWLRDWSRDRRGISQQQRAQSEQKNAVGVRMLLALVVLGLVGYRMYVVRSSSSRLIDGLIGVVAAISFWRAARAYSAPQGQQSSGEQTRGKL